MMLSLLRFAFTPESTIGRLLINDEYFCWTLELPGDGCIPAGVYEVKIDYSVRFKRMMPHILNVGGHTGIRIHWGNTALDTKGCQIVGYSRAQDFVGDSRHAFEDLYAHLDKAEHIGEAIYINIMKDPEAS